MEKSSNFVKYFDETTSSQKTSVNIISKCMYGLQACSCKYIFVAAVHIYSQSGEDVSQRGGCGRALHFVNSHGNYIVDYGKSWKNHGRTSDGGDGNHSVSLPIILIKIQVDQMLQSSYTSSLLASIL